MKALLICPEPRPAVSVLTEKFPLAVLPLLGETVIEVWLRRLAAQGVGEVVVLTSDRPEAVEEIVEDGARWGLDAKVVPTVGELTDEEALARYGKTETSSNGAVEVIRLEHLPGLHEGEMFASYRNWFLGVQFWLAQGLAPERVGWRQIRPGVYVGLNARISRKAKLVAPCWIGQKVFLGSGVTVGPMAVVEDCSIVETGAEIVRSIVGPETLVGRYTEVCDSLAWGDTLVDWKSGSWLRVPESFLLGSLRQPPAPRRKWKLAGLWPVGERERRLGRVSAPASAKEEIQPQQ